MKIQSLQFDINSGWKGDLKTAKGLDSENTLVYLFGAPEFSKELWIFDEIKKMWPKSSIIGCSSSGEIFGNEIHDNTLSLAVVKFERSRFKVVTLPITRISDSYQIGKDVAVALNERDLAGVFILSDGLMINGTDLVNGINSLIPNKIVTGGLAGDGPRFQKTWVLKDGYPESGYVNAVGIYGNKVHVGHGSKGGWEVFGQERTVTKSNGNVVYELDGEPALALYKKYLGEKAKDLPAAGLFFPLQIRSHLYDQKRIVRTVLGTDDATQSLKFAGSIPQGSLAQLMRANFDRLIDGAAGAAENLSSESKGPVLSLAVSCVGRRVVLGERTVEEVEAVVSKIPKTSHQVGFYSYGEICPFDRGHATELHNQTMTITTISEDEAA